MKHLSVYFLSSVFVLLNNSLFSQKVKTEEGSFTYKIETNITEEEAEKKARVLAQINAIENAFGKIIVQGNATFIQNTTTGQKAESSNTFNFIADSYVNGEWLETLDEKKEVFNQPDGSRWLKLSVKGKIRELKNILNICETYTLSCPQLTCKATEFNNGQSLYVYFKSPKEGFISIYFDDPYEKVTSRILPYIKSKTGTSVNFPVLADKEYFLFSPKHDYLNDAANIDELELTANTQADLYKIYVFYSPIEFDKPLLNNLTNQILKANEINAGYTLPPSLPSEQFQKWQIIVRGKNPDIEMQTILVTVKK